MTWLRDNNTHLMNKVFFITNHIIIRLDNKIFGDEKLSDEKLSVYNKVSYDLSNTV